MRIGQVEVVPIAKETVHQIMEDRVTSMAGEVAFRLILSLPPFMIFFAALSSLVDNYTGVDVFGWLQGQLENSPLPGDVQGTINILLDTVQREGSPGVLSFGILFALWAASGAIDVLMRAFNRAYDATELRGFVRRRLIAIGLTIGLSILIISSFILFVFGEQLGMWLANQVDMGGTFAAVWNIARWPAIVVLFMFALAVLYWAGPVIDHSIRWITPGAILATVLWLLATWGFGLYLQFSDPGSAYGALGTMVVLLLFLYISSIVLLIGAELNAVIDKKYDPVLIREKASDPEHQKDAGASQERALEMARREGKSPEDVGVTDATRERSHDPAHNQGRERVGQHAIEPEGGALVVVLGLLGSLFLAGLFGIFRKKRPEEG